MSNELVHGSVGTSLSQLEFEAVGLHVCNSQATGDLIYASSSSQLSRLGIGSTNKVLTVIGGVPTWQSTLAGLTLTAPVINGVVTTTGLTLPAVTLDGNVSINSGIWIFGNASSDALRFAGGGASNKGAIVYLFGEAYAGDEGAIWLQTPNAALDGEITRLKISGKLDTAVATWSAVTHVGLVLGGNMTVSAFNLITDTATGTKIGTAANQKIGFFNAAPRVQCAKATFNNWAAFGDVVNALVSLGLFDAA